MEAHHEHLFCEELPVTELYDPNKANPRWVDVATPFQKRMDGPKGKKHRKARRRGDKLVFTGHSIYIKNKTSLKK